MGYEIYIYTHTERGRHEPCTTGCACRRIMEFDLMNTNNGEFHSINTHRYLSLSLSLSLSLYIYIYIYIYIIVVWNCIWEVLLCKVPSCMHDLVKYFMDKNYWWMLKSHESWKFFNKVPKRGGYMVGKAREFGIEYSKERCGMAICEDRDGHAVQLCPPATRERRQMCSP